MSSFLRSSVSGRPSPGGARMYQIRFRKSASGICSRPSGIAEFSVTRSDLTLDLSMIASLGPAMTSFTWVAVFSVMRPLSVWSSLVSTSTCS